MQDKMYQYDQMNWSNYTSDAWYAHQQAIMFRARQERARVVREGLLWLVAQIRRPFTRPATRPEPVGIDAGTAPGHA